MKENDEKSVQKRNHYKLSKTTNNMEIEINDRKNGWEKNFGIRDNLKEITDSSKVGTTTEYGDMDHMIGDENDYMNHRVNEVMEDDRTMEEEIPMVLDGNIEEDKLVKRQFKKHRNFKKFEELGQKEHEGISEKRNQLILEVDEYNDNFEEQTEMILGTEDETSEHGQKDDKENGSNKEKIEIVFNSRNDKVGNNTAELKIQDDSNNIEDSNQEIFEVLWDCWQHNDANEIPKNEKLDNIRLRIIRKIEEGDLSDWIYAWWFDILRELPQETQEEIEQLEHEWTKECLEEEGWGQLCGSCGAIAENEMEMKRHMESRHPGETL